MKLIERTRVPATETISDISILEATPFADKIGFPAYGIHSGSQDVVKIEFLFPAGLIRQVVPFLASTCNYMMQEGTKTRTSDDIAQTMDYYGSYLEFEIGKDYGYASLYSPNKCLENTLPVFADILINSTVPDRELELFINKAKQNFAVNMQKVGFVATNKFNEMLFGNDHPYGKNATGEEFDRLSKQDIEKYYSKCYRMSESMTVVSGKIPKALEGLFMDSFKLSTENTSHDMFSSDKPTMQVIQRKEIVSMPDSVQSAIRVGRVLFNKKNEDFFGMIVLNTILGGYFGSRLMANIREDKGYTYGISSSVNSALQGGSLIISTEVGSDVSPDTLNQIYIELKRLREEVVPEEELNLVKNYMLGAFLRSTDGPFNLAEKFKSILEYDLDYTYYARFIKTIKEITAIEINELANKYLQEEDFQELVVGKS